MAKKLQLRRGTTSQHSSFTGAVGEVTVDTDKKVVVVHDGSTAGGVPLAKATTVALNTAKVTNVTTDLGVTANGTSLIVTSSDGTNASIPAVTTTAWGVMTDEDKVKLDAVETSADVTDATNVTAAGAGMLADDQTWSGSQRGGTHAIGTVNSGDAVIPLDSGNHFTLTAGGNVNIKFMKNATPDAITADEVGQTGTILVTNGAHTPTWENTAYFAGGLSAAPTITQSADTLLTYTVIATDKIVVAGLSAIGNS